MSSIRIRALFACALLVLAGGAAAYDPLDRAGGRPAPALELTVDPQGERPLPLRICLPERAGSCPVVVFSHGLGGTNRGATYLGDHWSARGFAAVFVQHPGSDESVWREQPLGRRMASMKQAASGRNLVLRVRDISRVLDALAAWNGDRSHPLSGRLDLTAVGMSGHSFGAVTTQAVSGQSMPLLGARFTDARIRAALPMSPSSPRMGDPASAFGSVSIPWMLFTGTEDVSPIGNQDVASRLAVYPALPASTPHYELVLDKAPHAAFVDRGPLSGAVNPNHHRAVLALSTAFWDTYLRGDAAAKAWLHSPAARSVLEAADRWQWHAPR